MSAAAAAIHQYLESLTPHVVRGFAGGPITLYAEGAKRVLASRATCDVAISYPVDVVEVTTGDHRDSLTGHQVYCARVRYADGCFADYRSLYQRERNEFALIMRGLLEAAQANAACDWSAA